MIRKLTAALLAVAAWLTVVAAAPTAAASGQEIQRVLDYWTPERMKAARPAPVPATDVTTVNSTAAPRATCLIPNPTVATLRRLSRAVHRMILCSVGGHPGCTGIRVTLVHTFTHVAFH
jgi:hypothetical protein